MRHPASPPGRRAHLTPVCLPGPRCGQGLPSPEAPHRVWAAPGTASDGTPAHLPAGSVLDAAEPPTRKSVGKSWERSLRVLPPCGQWELLHVPTWPSSHLPPPVPVLFPRHGPHPEPGTKDKERSRALPGVRPGNLSFLGLPPSPTPKGSPRPGDSLQKPHPPPHWWKWGHAPSSVLKPSQESTSLEGLCPHFRNTPTWRAGSVAPSTGV